MGGLLQGLIGDTSRQAVAAAPAPPTIDNSASEAAAEKQRQAMLAGRSSTILTGGAGLADTGATSSSKLLGQP